RENLGRQSTDRRRRSAAGEHDARRVRVVRGKSERIDYRREARGFCGAGGRSAHDRPGKNQGHPDRPHRGRRNHRVPGLNRRSGGFAGPAIYSAVVVGGSTMIALAMHALHFSIEESRSVGFVLAAMWVPALARLVATRTVDRGWESPFPVRRWGTPPFTVI